MSEHVTPTKVSREEYELRIKEKRLEAQRRRSECQRKAASTLELLALQQQQQIEKLQEFASYDSLRRHSSSDTRNNVKFSDGSVYVNSFNPSVQDANSETKEHSQGYAELLDAGKDDNVRTKMINREETRLPDNNEVVNISPSMTSPLTNVISSKTPNADDTPTIGNDCKIPEVALLPCLGIDLDCFVHDSPAKTVTEIEKIGNCHASFSSSNRDKRDVIDLSKDSTDNSDAVPKKKYKTTKVEVRVQITMPGLKGPYEKKVHSQIRSSESTDDSDE